MGFAADNPQAFGEKIPFEAVEYNPLYLQDPGYGNAAGDVAAGNQRNLPAFTGLAKDTNAFIDEDTLARINKMYPGFGDAFGQQQSNTLNLLRGVIPYEDAAGIAGRRAEAASLAGGGFPSQQVAADLGLTRLGLMQQGQQALQANANLAETINPVNRRLLPQSMFVDTMSAISAMISENQFDASFAQQERNAEFNAALVPDPQAAGMLNLMAGQAGYQAGGIATQSPMISGILSGANAYLANRQQPQATTFQSDPQYAALSAQNGGVTIRRAQAADTPTVVGGGSQTTAESNGWLASILGASKTS
jgi:hypothetical protein